MPGFIAMITLIGLACFPTVIGRLLSPFFTRNQIVGYNRNCVSDIFEAKVVTLLEPIKKFRPTKWDTKPLRMSKKFPKRRKLAILQSYEDMMAEGYDRDEILEQLEGRLGVTDRQVERIIAQAKRYREEIEMHFAELSATALKLAEILDWYYKHHRFTIEPLISSDFPYTAHVLEVPTLSERELSNLMAHLKDEIPELIAIGEYPKACKQWFALGDKKWEEETPSVMITEDLVLKLRLRGNQGNFSGKCPDCPR